MLAQIKLYGTIALALALIGMGFWFKGVLAQRTALKLQVTSLQSSIVTRDVTISQLNRGVQETNAILDKMAQEKKDTDSRASALQDRLNRLTADYQALSVQHQAPLPTGCEEAVREAARRAGAK